ncbi:MAG: hypothetical protein D3916_02320 [Candidatus Electrothrix sp. MAN1_4]|nr:hypothetical protein [Candidatus Electrothrix sp. MAN1_4]
MDFHLSENKSNSVVLAQSKVENKLPIKGQGIVRAYSSSIEKHLLITLTSDDLEKKCTFYIGYDCFKIITSNQSTITEFYQSSDPALLVEQDQTNQSYWISLDSNNRKILYGKGEPLPDLTLREIPWKDSDNFELIARHLQLVTTKITRSTESTILKNPVNIKINPLIIPEDEITLDIIAQNTGSVVRDLPMACQTLYGHIAHENINLAPPDFPEFTQAIQYSINKPGCICYEKLKEKGEPFGYLRITLDPNLGDSPGQPYVLEIWPAGNGSPIHNHGGACAVIKVLHGQIQISWYKTLSPSVLKPWGNIIAHKGNVTFLTPNYYQIHKLFNPSPKDSGDFCATIQCYKYSAEDLAHYECFDYIKKGEVKHFLPDSDWSYLDFKKAIQEEWQEAMNM